ncbi:MAG TPA: universal stress protein, partial [Longimicrobiaceae bacterium]|nr:universal stress protein [Longimicrobiaceae bacterium]
MIRRIAVGIDLEPPSTRAARWAAHVFGQAAELLLVHCLSTRPAPPFLEDLVAPLEERARAAHEEARARLEKLAESLRASRVSVEIRRGRPAEVLAEVAADREADLAVLGEHGRRPALRGSLGSSASQLPSICPVPVLIKRHLPERHPKRVLAAVDHSGGADAVLRWAARLSTAPRGPIQLIIHMSMEPEWSHEQSRPEERGRTGEDQNRLRLAREWLANSAEEAGLPAATIDVSSGDPRYE